MWIPAFSVRENLGTSDVFQWPVATMSVDLIELTTWAVSKETRFSPI